LFLNLGARWGVGDQRHTPTNLQPEKRRDINYTGGWVSPMDGLEDISPPEFNPRTIKPITNRYTDCAIPACIIGRDRTKMRAII